MFGIKIDSREKLVSEFAQELDMSNMEAWPYVDLTDQRVGVHVDLNLGDPTCEPDAFRSSVADGVFDRVVAQRIMV